MTRATELALATLYFFNPNTFKTWTMEVYEAEQQTEAIGELPENWENTFYGAWENNNAENLPDFIYGVLEDLYTDVQSLAKNLYEFAETIKGRA